MLIFYIVVYLLVILTVAIIIVNTNSSSKALAYLFLVFTFPIIGIMVYFSFGMNYRKNKLYDKKLKVDKEAFPELDRMRKKFSDDTLADHGPKLKHFLNLAHFNRSDSILTPGNRLKLLINGEEKFPEVLESLRAAKHHIHIEYYIYENDTIGSQIAEILKQKARDGVEIRFIYDDFGSQTIRRSFVRELREAGIEAVPFYKIKLIVLANRINYRNHRKVIVIDGKVGFVGGINVSDKYINPNEHLYWRDTHLKIEGLAVCSLQKVFLADWNFCAKQDIGVTPAYFPMDTLNAANQGPGDQLVELVYSGPDSDHPNIMYSLVQAILLSKKEILITTPYFIPEPTFIDALKIAALSGVAIKILVPGVSDSIIVNAVANSNYLELLEAGIEIYKYQKGFVHAKTMVCDRSVSFVGTANLDQRSFDLNFEINAVVFDEGLSEELRIAFLNDLSQAEKLELMAWQNRSYTTVLLERTVRLFAPLM